MKRQYDLTDDELQIILQMLGEGRFSVVQPVITSLIEQFDKYQPKPADTIKE